MNLKKIIENQAGDTVIEFLTKLFSKPYGRAIAMPKAWELKQFGSQNFVSWIKHQNSHNEKLS